MSGHSHRRHILLVDDEPGVRYSLAGVLDEAGYDVSTAENGFDALLQLRKLTPDVIISDLNMPQMSGFEFLSVVRRRFPDIPVIAVSGAYESGGCVLREGAASPRRALAHGHRTDSVLGGAGGEPSPAVGSGLDPSKRKGFQ